MKLEPGGLVSLEAFGSEWVLRFPSARAQQTLEAALGADAYDLPTAAETVRGLLERTDLFESPAGVPDGMLAQIAPRVIQGVWVLCNEGKPRAGASGTSSSAPTRSAEEA